MPAPEPGPGPGAADAAEPVPSGRRRALRRLAGDRAAVAGLVVVGLFVVAAVAAPLLSPADPVKVDFLHRFASPTPAHPLGTDNLGRDELSRILFGARLSIGMAVAATTGISVMGLLMGLVAGAYGPVAGAVIMRVVDVLLALPTLILALVVVGLLGQSLRTLIVTLALVGWPNYARIVRGMTLSIREREFVEAARAAGASRRRIVARHVAPNLVGPLVVLSTLDLGRVLLAVSGLSFLGFGVAPPTPEWGAMLSEAKAYLDRAPQLMVWPGLAITILVLSFNLAGDGIRDLLDPRLVEGATAVGGGRRGGGRQRRVLSAVGGTGAAATLPAGPGLGSATFGPGPGGPQASA
ncbi:MAG: ABC transporter permease [Acidimicrobiales bacterium]